MKLFSSKKALLISGLLVLVFQVVLLLILSGVAPATEILLHQTTFSPEEFQAIYSSWGPEGARRFLSHYYLDFIYPVLYAVFLSCCLPWSWAKSNRNWLLIFPFASAIVDEIENVCQLSIIKGWLPIESIWFYVGATSSRVKWLCAGITIIAIAIGLLKKVLSKREKH